MSKALSALTGDNTGGYAQMLSMAPERMAAAGEGQYFIAAPQWEVLLGWRER